MIRGVNYLKAVLACLALLLPFMAYAALSGSLDEDAIAKRLTPDAVITVEYGTSAAPTAVASGDIGKKRYEYTCKMCHDTGVAGAPKLGDKATWQPRLLGEGMETLIKHAIDGYKAMPPKGGCLTCDDEEIKKTVEYMISKIK